MSQKLLDRIKNLDLPKLTLPKLRFNSRRPTQSDLINAESKIGSTIFGPVPAHHRREFFHDKNNIWIWHESWVDEHGKPQQFTIRYEVRTSGVYKKIAAGQYYKLEGAELANFRNAAHTYLCLVKEKLYHKS